MPRTSFIHSLFTPQFVHTYQRANSKLPIQTWYHHVGRKMQRFQNPANVFLPVAINVRTATDAKGGSTRIMVSPTDTEWYKVLCDEFRTIMGLPNSVAIDIQTPVGTCIEGMSHLRLSKVGELQVVDRATGAPICIKETAKPSRRMATDKGRDLRAWYEDELRDGLVQVVRAQLEGKTMQEINMVMAGDQAVHQALAEHVASSVPDWQSFLDTYAADDLARDINLGDVYETATKIAEGLLKRVRAGIRANAPHIQTFFAQQAANQASTQLKDGPLFQQHVATGISKYQDDGMMWRDIAEDVFYSGRTASIPVNIVKRGYQRYSHVAGCSGKHYGSSKRSYKYRGKKRGKRSSRMNAQVPVSSAIDKALTECAALAVGEQTLLQGDESYTGDTARALRMYHMFSNKHAFPVPPSDPVARPLPELVPLEHVERPMPELVPLKHVERPMPELVQTEDKALSIPELVRIPVRDMPGLEPIAHNESDRDQYDDLQSDIFVDDAPNMEDFL